MTSKGHTYMTSSSMGEGALSIFNVLQYMPSGDGGGGGFLLLMSSQGFSKFLQSYNSL